MPPRKDLGFNAPRALGDTTTVRLKNAPTSFSAARVGREAYLALFGPDEEDEGGAAARRHAPTGMGPPASADEANAGTGGSARLPSCPPRMARPVLADEGPGPLPQMARPVLTKQDRDASLPQRHPSGTVDKVAPKVTWSKRYTKQDKGRTPPHLRPDGRKVPAGMRPTPRAVFRPPSNSTGDTPRRDTGAQ